MTPVGANAADPLTDKAGADAFWRMLPRSDPIAAQEAVTAALGDVVARDRPSLARLQAVMTLDRSARKLVDALLINYVAGDARPVEFEKQYWQAAFELCGSFCQVHSYFLRAMRDRVLFQGWREYLPFVALRLFQHRQTELLLRPFVDDRFAPLSWKDIHEAYRFVESRKLLHEPLPVFRCHSEEKAQTTLEREYIHVLLQGLVNGAQFPPYDAFWTSRGVARWCEAAALLPQSPKGAEPRFVVDPDSDTGLARSSGTSGRRCLVLDIVPVLDAIRGDLVALRDGAVPNGPGPAPGQAKQVRVLRKVIAVCAPKPPVVARRGERKPAALMVEFVAGIPEILRALRNAPQRPGAAAPADVPEVEEITITAVGELSTMPTTITSLGAFSESSTLGLPGGPGTVTQWSTAALDMKHQAMKLVDRSDSGCRLHGQMLGASRVIPGTLVAIREDAAFPWTLAVVRRVDRIAGRRIDVGVEYVGTDPHGVIVSVASDADARAGGAGEHHHARFAAIYLPESDKRPAMPIRTLVLPARRFAAADRLTLWSAAATFTIRLKEPLEEQGSFIWSPFDIIDRRPRDDLGAAEAASTAS